MPFSAEQLSRQSGLWKTMVGHRFLIATRDGTIERETFARWMRQDYLFVEAAIPFMTAMVPKAPRRHWDPLTAAIGALATELKLFEERAEAVGVVLREVAPSFTNHAYISFLLASAYRESYAGAFTVLYTAEKAYHDSWTVVKKGIDRASPWMPFVENWAGEGFAQYVGWLESELDALAAEAGPAERARMAELFELTTRYEIAFWEMAVTDEAWPGIAGS
ncbi:MAG TPA: hypothetical protein VMS56_13030 [Thermoanaerobaculia bacterium]|nr:hypothetical protein [Thermoanaerobaculia bacterium]